MPDAGARRSLEPEAKNVDVRCEVLQALSNQGGSEGGRSSDDEGDRVAIVSVRSGVDRSTRVSGPFFVQQAKETQLSHRGSKLGDGSRCTGSRSFDGQCILKGGQGSTERVVPTACRIVVKVTTRQGSHELCREVGGCGAGHERGQGWHCNDVEGSQATRAAGTNAHQGLGDRRVGDGEGKWVAWMRSVTRDVSEYREASLLTSLVHVCQCQQRLDHRVVELDGVDDNVVGEQGESLRLVGSVRSRPDVR